MNKKIVYTFIMVWLFGVITGILMFFIDINIYLFRFILFVFFVVIVFLSLNIGGFVAMSNWNIVKKIFKNKVK